MTTGRADVGKLCDQLREVRSAIAGASPAPQ